MIKSTYIHLKGHVKRGLGDFVCLRALASLVFGMAWMSIALTCCIACLLANIPSLIRAFMTHRFSTLAYYVVTASAFQWKAQP